MTFIKEISETHLLFCQTKIKCKQNLVARRPDLIGIVQNFEQRPFVPTSQHFIIFMKPESFPKVKINLFFDIRILTQI